MNNRQVGSILQELPVQRAVWTKMHHDQRTIFEVCHIAGGRSREQQTDPTFVKEVGAYV
jgi:hypothetical protein